MYIKQRAHLFVGTSRECEYCRRVSDHPNHAMHLVLDRRALDYDGPPRSRTPPTIDPDLIGIDEPYWTGPPD